MHRPMASISLAAVPVLFRKVIIGVISDPIEFLLQIASLPQPCPNHLI